MKKGILYILIAILCLGVQIFVAGITGDDQVLNQAKSKYYKGLQEFILEEGQYVVEENNWDEKNYLYVVVPKELQNKEFIGKLEKTQRRSGELWTTLDDLTNAFEKQRRQYQVSLVDAKGKNISMKKALRMKIISNLDYISIEVGEKETLLPSSPWTDKVATWAFRILSLTFFILGIATLRVYQVDKKEGRLDKKYKHNKENDIQLDEQDELYLEEEDYDKYYRNI